MVFRPKRGGVTASVTLVTKKMFFLLKASLSDMLRFVVILKIVVDMNEIQMFYPNWPKVS